MCFECVDKNEYTKSINDVLNVKNLIVYNAE